MSHSHIIEDSLLKPGELHLVWLFGSLPYVGAVGLVSCDSRPSVRLLSWHFRRMEYCSEHEDTTLTSTSVTMPSTVAVRKYVTNFEVASSVRWGYVTKQLNRSVYVKGVEGVLCSGN